MSSDNTYVLRTDGKSEVSYPGNVVMSTRDQFLNFKVKSCDHVQVRHSSQFNEELPTFSLDIGSNGNNEITASSSFSNGKAYLMIILRDSRQTEEKNKTKRIVLF